MKVHEYQAKKFFASYGLPVDRNIVCKTPEEAVAAYKQLGVEKAVVKAQVHTGGRGKAGGVKLGNNEAEIRQHAEAILGMNIKGFVVDRVLVSEAVDIASEYYMSILVDRKSKCPMLMLSRAGGMDIEQVAKETPEKIEKIVIDPVVGMSDYLAREAAFKLFDNMAQVKQAVPIFKNIYRLFTEKDASLAEINPLVMLKDGTLKAIDAKMTFDDNALFRHPDVAELFEPTAEERKEREAKDKGFSYVNLGGSIGCMVNGAGLAMAKGGADQYLRRYHTLRRRCQRAPRGLQGNQDRHSYRHPPDGDQRGRRQSHPRRYSLHRRHQHGRCRTQGSRTEQKTLKTQKL